MTQDEKNEAKLTTGEGMTVEGVADRHIIQVPVITNFLFSCVAPAIADLPATEREVLVRQIRTLATRAHEERPDIWAELRSAQWRGHLYHLLAHFEATIRERTERSIADDAPDPRNPSRA